MKSIAALDRTTFVRYLFIIHSILVGGVFLLLCGVWLTAHPMGSRTFVGMLVSGLWGFSFVMSAFGFCLKRQWAPRLWILAMGALLVSASIMTMLHWHAGNHQIKDPLLLGALWLMFVWALRELARLQLRAQLQKEDVSHG